MLTYRTRLLRAGVLGLSVYAALPVGVSQAASANAVTRTYAVSAGPLNQVLNQFAQQSGVLLSYDPALTQGKTSQGLRGSFSVEQGFQSILTNSGLQAQVGVDGTVTLAKQTPATPAAAPANTAAKNEQIVVTAPPNTALKLDTPLSETPRAVAVVNAQQIEERGAKKIDQALRYSAGVLATPYGPDNKTEWLVIRGFSDLSRFQNGLATLNEDGFYTQQLEPFGVERIEVLKGPASVLYGQNPPGGLVNVITKRPTRLPQGQVSVEYGSNDYRQLAVDSSGPLNDDGTVLYRVVGTARDTSGEVDFADSKRFYLAPSLTFLMGDNTELTLLSSYMDTRSGMTNGFKTPYGTLHDTPYGKVGYKTSLGEPSLNRFDSRQLNLGYEFTHHLNDTWTFHQNTNYTYLNMDLRGVYAMGQLDDRTVNRGLTYRDGFAQNWSVDNRMVGEWRWGDIDNTLLLGVDYRRANTQSRDADLSPYNASLYQFNSAPLDIFSPVYGRYTLSDNQLSNHRSGRHQSGYYVQNQIKYDDRLILLLGGRYDDAKSYTRNTIMGIDSRTSDTKFTKTAGAMYLFDNGISPYVSYAESFQPLADYDAYGNQYKPTMGKQTEVGVKYTPQGFNGYASAALYNLRQENILTTDVNNPSRQVQSGEARSRGIELELSGEVYKGVTLTSNYTYNNVETTKSGVAGENGKRLPGLPEHMFSTWVSYAFSGPLEGLTVGSGVRYIGSSYGDRLESASLKVPAYTLWDAMIAYDVTKNWRVQVNATNLANHHYVSACNFWCYYGEGRDITANVTYRW